MSDLLYFNTCLEAPDGEPLSVDFMVPDFHTLWEHLKSYHLAGWKILEVFHVVPGIGRRNLTVLAECEVENVEVTPHVRKLSNEIVYAPKT